MMGAIYPVQSATTGDLRQERTRLKSFLKTREKRVSVLKFEISQYERSVSIIESEINRRIKP